VYLNPPKFQPRCYTSATWDVRWTDGGEARVVAAVIKVRGPTLDKDDAKKRVSDPLEVGSHSLAFLAV
jgi:hypothetical protein